MSNEPKPSNINNDLIIYRLDEIKGELIDIKKRHVTKEESAALKHEIEGLREDFNEYKNHTEAELQEIKKRGNITNWLYPTLSAMFTAVMTYLIIEYLKKN